MKIQKYVWDCRASGVFFFLFVNMVGTIWLMCEWVLCDFIQRNHHRSSIQTCSRKERKMQNSGRFWWKQHGLGESGCGGQELGRRSIKLIIKYDVVHWLSSACVRENSKWETEQIPCLCSLYTRLNWKCNRWLWARGNLNTNSPYGVECAKRIELRLGWITFSVWMHKGQRSISHLSLSSLHFSIPPPPQNTL